MQAAENETTSKHFKFKQYDPMSFVVVILNFLREDTAPLLAPSCDRSVDHPSPAPQRGLFATTTFDVSSKDDFPSLSLGEVPRGNRAVRLLPSRMYLFSPSLAWLECRKREVIRTNLFNFQAGFKRHYLVSTLISVGRNSHSAAFCRLTGEASGRGNILYTRASFYRKYFFISELAKAKAPSSTSRWSLTL